MRFVFAQTFLSVCACTRTRALHAGHACVTRVWVPPAAHAFRLPTHTTREVNSSPSQHQTGFKCVEGEGKKVICGRKKGRKIKGRKKLREGGREGINEMEFKAALRERKDSVNTAGCIAVALNFTDSIFPSVPLIHPP